MEKQYVERHGNVDKSICVLVVRAVAVVFVFSYSYAYPRSKDDNVNLVNLGLGSPLKRFFSHGFVSTVGNLKHVSLKSSIANSGTRHGRKISSGARLSKTSLTRLITLLPVNDSQGA